MGIVIRQSVKKTIVSLFGSFLGAINTLFIITAFLEEDQIGFISTMASIASILVPFVNLGCLALVSKYYPYFKTKKGDNGFFLLTLIIAALGNLSFFFLNKSGFLQTVLYDKYILSFPLFEDVIPWIPLLVTFMGLQSLLVNHVLNFKRIVVPEIIRNVTQKILYGIFCIVFSAGLISFLELSIGYIFIFGFNSLCLFFYLRYLGGVTFSKIKFPSKELPAQMATMSFITLVTDLGSVLVNHIDKIMLSSLASFGSTGIYTIVFFIANIIAIPGGSLYQISTPLTAQYMKDGNLKEVDILYKKTSIIGIWVGLLFFSLIILGFNSLFELIPNGSTYSVGFMAFIYLGLSKVLDVAFSNNHHIIQYSDYYYINSIAIIFVALINIGLNLYLIPRMGLEGAALATLISVLFINSLKCFFVLVRFKIQPFSLNSILTLGLSGMLCVIFFQIVVTGHPLLTILLRSSLFSAFFIILSYYLKISLDVNLLIDKVLSRFF